MSMNILLVKVFTFLVRSKEFADGINELAKVLNTRSHPNPLVTLTAVRKVITKRLAAERVENPDNYILTVNNILYYYLCCIII